MNWLEDVLKNSNMTIKDLHDKTGLEIDLLLSIIENDIDICDASFYTVVAILNVAKMDRLSPYECFVIDNIVNSDFEGETKRTYEVVIKALTFYKEFLKTSVKN